MMRRFGVGWLGSSVCSRKARSPRNRFYFPFVIPFIPQTLKRFIYEKTN
jgi:hypothetical protein